jgi:hypothetical protein
MDRNQSEIIQQNQHLHFRLGHQLVFLSGKVAIHQLHQAFRQWTKEDNRNYLLLIPLAVLQELASHSRVHLQKLQNGET